jgi:diguanylate cyclase (GGDEF)-like protein
MTPTEITSLLTGLARTCQQQMSTEGQFRRDLETIFSRLQGSGLVIRVRVNVNRGTGAFETLAEYGGPSREEIDALGSNIHAEGSYRFTVEGWCYREAESFDVSRSREMYQATFPPLVSLLTEHWGKRDTMTLLPRYADSGQRQRLERAIRAASLDGGPITAVHTDLDLFKQVNSEFGESGGDAVLREFGARIRTSFGDDSIAVRKGGEEFSIFFPRSGLGCVLPRLERFRQMMASTSFAHINRPNTCSSGIASFPLHVQAPTPPKELADALLDATMQAERRAKEEGRNCIRLAGAVVATPHDETDAILREDLVEAALWARHNLSPHDTSCFGAELHTFLAEYLVDRFRNATVDQG